MYRQYIYVPAVQRWSPFLNRQYKTGVPVALAEALDAKAEPEGWTWREAYKLALWLGLVAIEEKGGLRGAEAALGGSLEAVSSAKTRSIKVPRDARDLVDMAEREGIEWQRAQHLALAAGLKTIEARGGLNETKRQIEALRRSVVTHAFGGRGG
jgi:hypothetical protein